MKIDQKQPKKADFGLKIDDFGPFWPHFIEIGLFLPKKSEALPKSAASLAKLRFGLASLRSAFGLRPKASLLMLRFGQKLRF